MARLPGPPAAPPRVPQPRPGEDALSAVLGGTDEEDADEVERQGGTLDPQTRLIEARVLTALGESQTPVPLQDLASKVTAGFFQLSKLVVELEKEGVIVLDGSPGHEVVSLAPDYVY
jgi:hypothetical protein